MVGPVDPGHDRDPQLLTGRPALPVEDVLLQQGEERLLRRVVTGRADPAHRADHAVPVQLWSSFLDRNWPAVDVQDRPGDHRTISAAPREGIVERRDRERGFHARVDAVTDDPVGVHVLDRAQVQLALTGQPRRLCDS